MTFMLEKVKQQSELIFLHRLTDPGDIKNFKSISNENVESKTTAGWTSGTHTYNPSYSGGGD
jgi:hypothetical protein